MASRCWIHLHDNDGKADQHRVPFTGTVDWTAVAALLASSSYTKCISLECTNKEALPEEEFLARAFAAGSRLSEMAGHGRPRPVQ